MSASTAAGNAAFERALAGEILASERLRMWVLAAALGLLLLFQQLLFLSPFRETLQSFAYKPLPP